MTNQTRTEPLDRLAELEQAATPGPWEQGRGETFSHWIDAANEVIVTAQQDPDAAFIAALRNAAPSLIAEAREAARLRTALEEIAYWEGAKVAPHEGFDFDAHTDCSVEEGCPAMVARAALVKP